MSARSNAPLSPANFYHIYNWGINEQEVFFSRENYCYFLRNFHKHLDEIASLYAYCLLPNQYHFLLRIKEVKRLPQAYQVGGKVLNQAFDHAFHIYAELINKQENRLGPLFQPNFHISALQNREKLRQTVYHIHTHPRQKGLHADFRTYSFSSYQKFIQGAELSFRNREVFEWFGTKEGFIDFHERKECPLEEERA